MHTDTARCSTNSLKLLCLCQVSTGGLACRLSTGQCGDLTTKMTRYLPPVHSPNQGNCRATHEHNLQLHRCVSCGAVFKGSSQLECHIRAKHAGGRYACTLCKCTFAWKSGLNEHVKFKHQKLARYWCEICGKGYAHRSNYYDHLATHTGIKRNVCTVCQKEFTFKHNLKVHILRLHPDK